jgi:ABC-type amino acid transport substrate-binding protein/nitrogen-specific signal transduction histidine kinase/ActR/RegA family two-component response regulator
MLWRKFLKTGRFFPGVIRRSLSCLTGGSVFFIALIISCSPFFLFQIASASDPIPVRIGYYENPPKLFGGFEDKPKGIFPEIIEDIARKENWQLEWVTGTWQEGLNRLESGTIDILPDVAYSIKRTEKYTYSDEPVFINWAVLYTSLEVQINSLIDLEGKRIAVMRGSIHTDGEEGIKKQVEKFHINCSFVSVDSYDEVFLALQNDLADVGVVNRLFGEIAQKLYDVVRTTVVFNPRYHKFAFSPGGKLTPFLKKTIDNHLRSAASQPESKIHTIINTYLHAIPFTSFEDNNRQDVYLTPEEKSWIRAHPKIRIGIDPEFSPFEFYDKNGQYSGYSSDYIRILNERLGLDMEVVKGVSWKEAIRMVKAGDIDILPAVGYTKERSQFLLYTTPYVGFYRMIFCRVETPFISGLNDLKGLRVAVQTNSSHAGWIRDNTDLAPDYYDTLEDMILAVSEGRADVFIGNLATATYWIRQLNITNVRVAGPVSLKRQLLHMAVRRDWPQLANILNKGLASISSQDAEDIRTRWIASGYTVGLESRIVWQRIGIVLLLAALIIGCFWHWNRRLHREVTRRKVAEKKLVESQERLAEQVVERTKKLVETNNSLKRESLERQKLQEELHRSEKMKALGLLAGGVAHDLNNILTGIVSYPDLLLIDLPDSHPMRKPLEVIKDSGQRAADVVADLLTIARGVASVKISCNLNELIVDLMNSPEYLQVQKNYQGVHCEIDLAENLRLVLCSVIHIQKCLMNLLLNALEAMGDTGVLTITTSNIDGKFQSNAEKKKFEIENCQYVRLRISDTGPGISEDDIGHIFEPFYSKKVMGRSGTGLGLAVVWNTVQDHDGSITVTSNNSGTSFEILLPATEKCDAVRKTAVDSSSFQGHGERILVVDDEKELRDITCSMLSSMGYNAESTSSGEEALELIRRKKIDLLVLDMIMEPGLNGLETYEQILQLVPDQKAIIVSGFSDNDNVAQARRLGASAYIKKPFTYNQLGMSVKSALVSAQTDPATLP